MKSAVPKRSILLDGRKTSVTVENAFWAALQDIAHVQRTTMSKFITEIDATRKQSNLSSAIRIFVIEHHQSESNRTALAPR